MSDQPEKPSFEGLPKPEIGPVKPLKSADDGAAASGAAETPKEEKKEEKKEVKKEEKKVLDKKREKVDLSKAKIGFIGAGKMADAIIRGLIQFGKVDPKHICVSAKSTKNLENMKKKGCHITKSNYDIFSKYDCDVVFLCFHGNVIKQCYKLGGSRPHPFTTNYIPRVKHPIYILSLVCGVTLDQIRACLLNPDHPDKYMLEMHRICLNTASAYGIGLGAIDVEPDGKKCSPIVRDILSTISKLEYIPEKEMDAACALGGSGLAFVYYYIDALAKGGVKKNLEYKAAVKFAAKTAQCAALTVLESGKQPSELMNSCISPGGAATHGIEALAKHDFSNGFGGAVYEARERALALVDKEITDASK